MDIFDSELFGSFFNDWLKEKTEQERTQNSASTVNSEKPNTQNSTTLNSANGSGMGSYNSRKCPQPQGAFPKHTPIGMAYVPYQEWEMPYDEVVALARGTIFPSLDKPFIGEEAVRSARKR